MKLLVVTGSREWADERAVERAIETFAPDVVMHGDCHVRGKPAGADKIADAFCVRRGTNVMRVPALWARFDMTAGPLRNNVMTEIAAACLRGGMTVEAAAFPCPPSRGTIDCITRLRAVGVFVRVHGAEP